MKPIETPILTPTSEESEELPEDEAPEEEPPEEDPPEDEPPQYVQ